MKYVMKKEKQQDAFDYEKVLQNEISGNLLEIESNLKQILKNCEDVVFRSICIGSKEETGNKISGLAIFFEAATENFNLAGTALARCLRLWNEVSENEIEKRILEGGFGLIDTKPLLSFQEVVDGLLAGDTILFFKNVHCGLKIANKGYPGLGVSQADSEKGIRGSDESFGDSVKGNALLIRKRIRSPQLKVKEFKVGVRSATTVYLIYMEGIAKEKHVQEIEKRLKAFDIDRVLDSGVEQQLMSYRESSPFPQIQSTRRPSFAAEELLEGRLVLAFDNSPEVLMFPTVYQNFLMAADDSFLPYLVVALIRSLRYLAAFLAMVLPGLYIVACSFENQILPTDLMLAVIRASINTPFQVTTQILFMEVSFELLKEAGVRMPGDLGNAIGIVGGLIIGTAAVDAALVSPIVVIVVAFTALCSFSIPSEELNQAFRLVKFVFILVCTLFGAAGLFLGLMSVSLHLAGLTSLNEPLLAKVQPRLRKPMKETIYRSDFVDEGNKRRLRAKGEEDM